MRRAIARCRPAPQDIDCVNAHGTGTPKNDVVETAAIKEVPRAAGPTRFRSMRSSR